MDQEQAQPPSSVVTRYNLDALARANPEYVDRLFQAYKRDPRSVDERWRLIFAGYEFGLGQAQTVPAEVRAGEPVLGVYHMIHAYRQFGHLIADLDPLGNGPKHHPLLDLQEFGFTEADLDRVVATGSFRGLGPKARLGDLLRALEETYTRTVGVEFVFIRDKRQWDWLLDQMEPVRNRPELAPEERRRILERLLEAEGFERFLHAKYRGAKRFSLEGAEALIPLLDTLIATLGEEADEIVFGMPHRGRLNVLTHIMRKPYELMLGEFEGAHLPPDVAGAGDVKYHKGYSQDIEVAGRKVHLSLSPNPSHLEAIDPVVEGMVRAKQTWREDVRRKRVVPVLMHGDAAFAGQGIVYETLLLSRLLGFTTGGTVHIVINNQIGFTTGPTEARSTYYATDVARSLRAPVFHVNADDPEAVVHVARLAARYRQTFGSDVFIDLVCYRRHGHNEQDDPTFTQPVLYKKIAAHPPVTELYGRRLVEEGVVAPEWIQEVRNRQRARLDEAWAYAREHRPHTEDVAFRGRWQGLGWAGDDWSARTRVSADQLRLVARRLTEWPEGFHPHPRLVKHFQDMRERVERGTDLHWAIGELLAYGTLLLEGTPIRLTGQDSARGTFSHRHAVLYDYETGDPYVPLNHLGPEQAQIDVINSPLSEAAVLGFEYGFASADPWRLVLWEAQFGDFANGAQVIIDQFIVSGESKWQKQCGIVLLLPHGYEGQGPEHSSARPERFLQLCAERNIQVVNCTTPAQFFHVLRRQIHRDFRKPLVVLTPKSLLRHRRAVSSLAEFTERDFQPVLPDPVEHDPAGVKRVLLCSGKVFYALLATREELGLEGEVAIVRIEELYPFPSQELRRVLARYPEEAELFWVQEEPWNQGAWHYLIPIFQHLFGPDRPVRYVGRPESASPATGSYEEHLREEQAFLSAAFHKPGAAEEPSFYLPLAPVVETR